MSRSVDWPALVRAARRARRRAWAPYSRYRVGAAVLTARGNVFEGCNVENATYGAAVCAERCAVVRMVAAGERAVRAVAVVTAGPDPAAPCGICRQVIAEFAGGGDVLVGLATATGRARPRVVRLADLLPYAFTGAALRVAAKRR